MIWDFLSKLYDQRNEAKAKAQQKANFKLHCVCEPYCAWPNKAFAI